jgi:hypothetical protein
MGPKALLPLRIKLRCGFFSPLQIHRLRPGLNPRNMGPLANTLTARPLRATEFSLHFTYISLSPIVLGLYVVYLTTLIQSLRLYSRGDQLDQLREPQFRWQQSAVAMYSTLKFIKSKHCSVLTDEHHIEYKLL